MKDYDVQKEINSSEIKCNSLEDLENYVLEASKLLEKRHDTLLSLTADTELYAVKRKVVSDEELEEDPEAFEVILIYEEYYVLFSEYNKADAFLESFMDISMREEVEIVKIETMEELAHRLPVAVLGDDLIIKRIEFVDENEVCHCEDLIYDPHA